MNTSCGMVGLRDNAVEYRVMASSCRRASAAVSPRCTSFSAQRCLKSGGDQSRKRCISIAQALTYGPFRLFAMRVCRFAVHLVETLDCFRYTVDRFEMVAESPINRESRGCELRTNGMSSQREVPEQKEILTVRAATKASVHEPPVNFNFAHCLKSGVGVGVLGVVSTLLSGVERHRCKKSVATCRMHNGGEE